jgi:hypothetical protein
MKRQHHTTSAEGPGWTFPGFLIEETRRTIYTDSAMSTLRSPLLPPDSERRRHPASFGSKRAARRLSRRRS